jgi:hypothetical protein
VLPGCHSDLCLERLDIIRNIINVADAGACAVRVHEIPTVVDAIGGRQLLRLQGTRMGLNFMITSRYGYITVSDIPSPFS